MNDRFKFRFYDKDKKIMIKPIEEMSVIEWENVCSTYGQNEWYLCIEAVMPTILNYFDYDDFYKMNFEIMQCTGLKDKNGKLIYEGDIVNVKINGIKTSNVVVWDRKEWQLKKYNKNFKQNCSACEVKTRQKCQYCSQYFSVSGHTNFKDFYNNEVIGNIYENKELLNETNTNNPV